MLENIYLTHKKINNWAILEQKYIGHIGNQQKNGRINLTLLVITFNANRRHEFKKKTSVIQLYAV